MGMMAQIGINLVEIKSPFRTVISTLSSNRLTNHATLTCNLHPDHLALPRRSVFHPTATKTTTPIFHPTAAKTTTTTLRSTSLSPRKPTLHILVKSTALTSKEDNLVVDVLTDNMDAPMVEARYQDEEEVTAPLNGPEMVSI